MGVETMSLAEEIHQEIVDEMDRRKRNYFDEVRELWMKLNYRWTPKGSAGQALEWFDSIAEAHPDATREELGNLLEDRIKLERSLRGPHWFTVAHLDGVLAIVKGTYEVQDGQ